MFERSSDKTSTRSSPRSAGTSTSSVQPGAGVELREAAADAVLAISAVFDRGRGMERLEPRVRTERSFHAELEMPTETILEHATRELLVAFERPNDGIDFKDIPLSAIGEDQREPKLRAQSVAFQDA